MDLGLEGERQVDIDIFIDKVVSGDTFKIYLWFYVDWTICFCLSGPSWLERLATGTWATMRRKIGTNAMLRALRPKARLKLNRNRNRNSSAWRRNKYISGAMENHYVIMFLSKLLFILTKLWFEQPNIFIEIQFKSSCLKVFFKTSV